MPEQWEDEDVLFVHLWLTPEGLQTYHYEPAGFGRSLPQRVPNNVSQGITCSLLDNSSGQSVTRAAIGVS